MTRALIGSAALFLCTGPVACVQPPQFFSHDLQVVSMHPADGSAAVPAEVAPKIVFSQDIPRQIAFDVTVNRGALSTPMACTVSDDPAVLDCPLPEDLLPDAWYRIEVDIAADGELDAESLWTTGAPDGLAYDVGPDLAVEQLGGNDNAVALLEDLLLSGDDHLVMVLDGFSAGRHSLPWRGSWLLGNARVRENLKTGELEALIDEVDGLTISTRGTLEEDGTFTADADYATLPIEVDGQALQLLLEDVQLSGTIPLAEHEYERVQRVRLTAAVSEAALDDLAAAVPEWAQLISELAGVIKMDRDLDGDGTVDAATFQLSSSGDRVLLAE